MQQLYFHVSVSVYNIIKFFIEIQSETSQLTASFKYTDKESGVDHIKMKIFEIYQGTRMQKYPGEKFCSALFDYVEIGSKMHIMTKSVLNICSREFHI